MMSWKVQIRDSDCTLICMLTQRASENIVKGDNFPNDEAIITRELVKLIRQRKGTKR